MLQFTSNQEVAKQQQKLAKMSGNWTIYTCGWGILLEPPLWKEIGQYLMKLKMYRPSLPPVHGRQVVGEYQLTK